MNAEGWEDWANRTNDPQTSVTSASDFITNMMCTGLEILAGGQQWWAWANVKDLFGKRPHLDKHENVKCFNERDNRDLQQMAILCTDSVTSREYRTLWLLFYPWYDITLTSMNTECLWRSLDQWLQRKSGCCLLNSYTKVSVMDLSF